MDKVYSMIKGLLIFVFVSIIAVVVGVFMTITGLIFLLARLITGRPARPHFRVYTHHMRFKDVYEPRPEPRDVTPRPQRMLNSTPTETP